MNGLKVFHGGGIDAAAARYGRPVEQWLDLSTGINPRPPQLPALSPELWQRLPDIQPMAGLQHAAASYYGSGEILPLAAGGTQVLIRALCTIADSNRRVAILAPTYGEYQQVFSDAGFAVDLVSGLEAIGEEHGLVVVVNPNNPDGRVFQRGGLTALAGRLQQNTATLVIDEAFGDLTPELSLCGAVENFPRLIVLRSFGKFFGYAGLRLSFAVAGEAHAASIDRFLGPWPVSGPALAVGAALMQGDVEGLRATIRARRAALTNVLNDAGLTEVGGTDLFALVRVERAQSLFEHLAGEGILTRAFDYRPDWLRIGLFASDEDGVRLAAALKTYSIS